ncbi:hypothetical protein D5086_029412 [Populus alba]|uniref:Uncharacterized protein n=2 Tax=Populus alba TaxID=43335 RepID=A0ACC4ATH9_POPAL|nr:hypothetical protein D5086_0000317610 [Populus alba]
MKEATLPLDEDLPWPWANITVCTASIRYFAKCECEEDEHFKTKRHKKRMLKQMMGPAPHTQLDADLAAGMGAPDNGLKLMSYVTSFGCLLMHMFRWQMSLSRPPLDGGYCF